ncbi:MAG: hypothetical protein LBN97_09550 [Oscillospiraceae bacterium]|jgi:hypothetical protein|nr:hypothetical protein [Oscillospiraceae bacterium]
MELALLTILLVVTIVREFITERRLRALENSENLNILPEPRAEKPVSLQESPEERLQRLELEHFSNDVKEIFGYYAGKSITEPDEG